jgi:hypothetical protein
MLRDDIVLGLDQRVKLALVELVLPVADALNVLELDEHDEAVAALIHRGCLGGRGRRCIKQQGCSGGKCRGQLHQKDNMRASGLNAMPHCSRKSGFPCGHARLLKFMRGEI